LTKTLLLAAALASLTATPASAESWHEIAITGDAIGYGDSDSIAQRGEEVSARVMLGLREAMGQESNIEFLVSSVRFSCSEERYFVDQVSGLDGQRAVVATLPGSQQWKAVTQGTLYASFRDFACSAHATRRLEDPYLATVQFWRPDEELIEAATVELAGNLYAG
jgi:hypothetical protein